MRNVPRTRRYNTPPTHASLTVGQAVQVHAMGCWYAGQVAKKTPTKVVVQYATGATAGRTKTVDTSMLAPAGSWRVGSKDDGNVCRLREGETIEAYEGRWTARQAAWGLNVLPALVLAFALGGTGCGGGGADDSYHPSLDGMWWIDLNQACAQAMTFDEADHSYTSQIVCVTGNVAKIDLEGGAYETDGTYSGGLHLQPKAASCPSADHAPQDYRYVLKSNTQLQLSDASGGLIFSRLVGGGGGPDGGLRVTVGCWTMGTFTPHAVETL